MRARLRTTEEIAELEDRASRKVAHISVESGDSKRADPPLGMDLEAQGRAARQVQAAMRRLQRIVGDR